MKTKSKILPKLLYVFEDEGSDGSKFLIATTDPGERAEGPIGVYDLREILQVRHKLQFKRPGSKAWFDSETWS